MSDRAANGPRVALCGESTAAGYLLAPALTPATLLEAELGRRLGRPAPVLDLARTNERMAGLCQAVDEACRRGVELVVLFAGNNWRLLEAPELSPLAPGPASRREVARHLAAGGTGSLVEAGIRAALVRVVRGLEAIAESSRAAGVSVLAVVPEVNLADWESRQPPCWLPGSGAARWHRLLDRVDHRLEEDDLDGAIRAGRSLALAEGGLGPTPFHAIGEARRRQGDSRRARDAYREAIDRCPYPLALNLPAPRMTTAEAEVLLRFARDRGWHTVDLRQALRDPEGLPGRALFFDYCHLTEDGMAQAMAQVAAVAARALGGSDRGSIAVSAASVATADLARARLGAALHNARRFHGLATERIVRHWSRRALEAFAGAVDTMLDVADARTGGLDPRLTGASGRNRDAETALGEAHGWHHALHDGRLLAIWSRLLAEIDPPSRNRLNRLVEGRLAVGADWCELARKEWLWEPHAVAMNDLLDHDDMPERAFLRAVWPRLGFALVLSEPTRVEIDVTLRLPPIAGAPPGRRGRVALSVDGREVARFVVGESWTRRRARVTIGNGSEPVHHLALRWPYPAAIDSSALSAAASDLAAGLEVSLHPAFGDLWSLRVCRS